MTPRRAPSRRWGPAAVSGAILGLLAVMVAVVPPFILPASALPVTVGPNKVDELVQLQLRGLPGPDLLPRVPLPHADDE